MDNIFTGTNHLQHEAFTSDVYALYPGDRVFCEADYDNYYRKKHLRKQLEVIFLYTDFF